MYVAIAMCSYVLSYTTAMLSERDCPHKMIDLQ